MNRPYQVCTRCVMDTSAEEITFDARGVCNFCSEFLARSGNVLDMDPNQRQMELDAFISKVKSRGKGKRYDCVVGVSGGVDSSFALVQAVNLGLRPLAVHMDNGWDSELAQNNIANLVRELGVDLHTHVIEWGEYRELMQAFFCADVIDVEILSDNAIKAVNYQLAATYGIHYILSGSNTATEGILMPREWAWFKKDRRNIKAIAWRFRKMHLKTYPTISTLSYIYYEFIRGMKWVRFLDYFEYNKSAAITYLTERFNYKPYPYKHYESIFTRFYQGYILPEKFGVDKRRVHLSTLVVTGQMSRDEALRLLSDSPYPSEELLEEDKRYFLKKMGWSISQLKEYISRPGMPHLAYPSERTLWNILGTIYKRFSLRMS